MNRWSTIGRIREHGPSTDNARYPIKGQGETIMENRLLVCGTLLALVLLLPSFALAWSVGNSAPLQASGGMVAPKAPHETIRMEAEEVTMRLEKDGYTVEAVFVMANSGEAITEWVGFPKGQET
jgi:hypothetical protein